MAIDLTDLGAEPVKASDPLDFSDRYNTPIPANRQPEFNQWVASETKKKGKSPLGDRYDYDVNGYFLSGAATDARGHGTDQFKKPNHPTFSDESQYNGKDGYVGGNWSDAGYQPSRTNLKFRTKEQLQQYFKEVEPETKLLPAKLDLSDLGAEEVHQTTAKNLPSRDAMESEHVKAVQNFKAILGNLPGLRDGMVPGVAGPPSPAGLEGAPYDPSFLGTVKSVTKNLPGVIGGSMTAASNTPIVPLSKLDAHTKAVMLGNTILPGSGELFANSALMQGAASGMAETAEGLTTPGNIGLMGASEVAGLIPRIGKYLPRAISGGFSVDMLRNAYNRIPAVRDAIKKGDMQAAAKEITGAAASLGMAATAAGHALKAEPVAPPTAEKALESAQAGSEVLDTELPKGQAVEIPPPIPEAVPPPIPSNQAGKEEVRAATPIDLSDLGAEPVTGKESTDVPRGTKVLEPENPPGNEAETKPATEPASETKETPPFQTKIENGKITIHDEKGTPYLSIPVTDQAAGTELAGILRGIGHEDTAKQVEAAIEQPQSVPVRAETAEPGTIGMMATKDISVDPARFQFKHRAFQKGGVTDEFSDVRKFDPEKSGIISVWRDPKDGKTYVVNGHHRVELAQRLGAEEMAVRYLDAKDATQARLKGALINIAEGRGDAIDAAKVFRDSDMTAKELEAEGVSLKGEKARQGLALSKLDPYLFRKVVDGDLPVQRASIIGEGVKNEADQRTLYDSMESSERNGKRMTDDQVEEMIRLINAEQTVVVDDGGGQGKLGGGLGGGWDEAEIKRSIFREKAEISDYVRKRLTQERRLFATVGDEGAAKQLGEKGNLIKAGENKAVAEQVTQATELYDKLSTVGEVGQKLSEAAALLASGENSGRVKESAYKDIRAALIKQADRLTGRGADERLAGNGRAGSNPVGAGERNQESRAQAGEPGVVENRPGWDSVETGNLKGGRIVDDAKASIQHNQEMIENLRKMEGLDPEQRELAAKAVEMHKREILKEQRKLDAVGRMSLPEWAVKPFQRGQSTFFHNKEAYFQEIPLTEEEGRHAVAYSTNHSGVELLQRAASGGRVVDRSPMIGGQHIMGDQSPLMVTLLDRLRRSEDIPRPEGLFGDAIGDLRKIFGAEADKAPGDRKSVVFAVDSPNPETYKAHVALSEELNHSIQAAVSAPKNLGTHHLGASLQDFQGNRIYQKAESNLPEYNEAPPGVKAIEVGVRLMYPEGTERLGLNTAEARSLGARYVRMLRKEYGNVKPREVAEQIFENFRTYFAHPFRKSQAELRARAEGLRSEGGEGTPGGNGANPSESVQSGGDQAGNVRVGAEGPAEGLEQTSFAEGGKQDAQSYEAKLLKERLEAQLKAPITREEQLKKLKRDKTNRQADMFGGPAEEPSQGSLFNIIGDTSGEVRPGVLKQAVEKEIKPALDRVGLDIAEAKDSILKLVAPMGRGSAAEMMGLSLRQRMAQFQRRYDQGVQRLQAARQFFDSRTPEENFKFIDDIEHGRSSGDEHLDKIAGVFRRMMDQRREEVQSLGEGFLKGFYTNYFPHIFERSLGEAFQWTENFIKNRPMEGSKAFLKHREFPTFKEAIDAGMKPVSANPVDLIMLKAREMDRFLMAHHTLRDMADRGIAKRLADAQGVWAAGKLDRDWLVPTEKDVPAYFKRVIDPVGGGKWFAEEGAADVLNNYLTPGLRAKSGAYRILIGTNNVMNQANLGLSAFHVTGEIIRSMVGRAALGLEDIVQGKPIRGSARIATFAAGPFIDYVKGDKMIHEWAKPGSEGAPVAAMLDAAIKGGARAGNSAEYSNQMQRAMVAAFKDGRNIEGSLRVPLALLEKSSGLLFDKFIPRLKMGMFAEMAKNDMERLGSGVRNEELQRAFAKSWDSVDNRMGQMVYDNLFLNRTFKDLAHLSVRSVGWNLGTLREHYGAVKDLGKLALRRPDAEFSHRLSYTLMSPFVFGILGAAYGYAHGRPPKSVMDYLFPQRGDGTRMSPPTDTKDLFHWATDPVRTAENKSAPLISTILGMIHNRDFYDRPIRGEDDPYYKQGLELLNFVGRQMLPFTMQPSVGKKIPETTEQMVERFGGMNPAPKDLQPGAKRKARKSAYQ